jgi:autotransporter-associated beta strand protein
VGTVSVNGGRVNTATPNAVTGLNVAFGTPTGVLGTFNIRSATPSIASVSGGATGIANLAIGDGTSNSTLTINQSTDTQFGGNFTQEGTTVAGVVKLGTGTLTLTGLTSNYSGGITITGGKVISNGASLGTGLVTLNGGTLAAVPNGLLGEYWDVTKGGDANAQGGFGGDLTQFNSYFAGKGSANLAVPTTTAGRTNLRFSTGAGLDGGGFDPGSPFADQGFLPDNNIAVRLSGTFFAEVAGDYSFLTRSDDGSVLFVDGTKVVNNNNYQGMTNVSGVINLAAGTHAISVGFYEGGGGAGLEVRYTPPGGVDQFITNDILGGLSTTNNVRLQSSSTIDPAGGSRPSVH